MIEIVYVKVSLDDIDIIRYSTPAILPDFTNMDEPYEYIGKIEFEKCTLKFIFEK